MRTFTAYKNDYASMTNNSEAGNLTLGEKFINDSIRTVCNLQGGRLRFLEAVKEMTTVATQEEYQIPNNFRKLMSILVWSEATTAGVPYTPEMIFDPAMWNRVKQMKLGDGDVPYYTYIEAKKYAIQPTPSTSGNLIQLRGRLQTRDLSIADYTTGTIVSVANGGTTVIGAGTTWTADMVGRYIRITQTTAANAGDGFWYEIGGFTNSTTIVLTKPYEGTAIAVGSATYTIGQCSVIPEAYDIAPVYRSAALYYQQQKDLAQAKTYWMMYDGGMEAGYSNVYGGIISQMLANEGETEEGSYIPPAGTTNTTNAPYYFPMSNASGF
jgi:hypothetical protein